MRNRLVSNRIFTRIVVCLTLMSFLSVFGCDSGGGNGGGQAETFVTELRGKAFYNGPVSGANVSFYDEEGVPLTSESSSTDSKGYFISAVTSLPERFYIEVTGGEVLLEDENGDSYSEPFTESIGRYMDGFDPDRVIKINILSSLLLEAWALEAELEYEAIKKGMHRYLHFPGYYTTDDVIDMADWNTAIFDPQYFFEGMEENGYSDYDLFVDYSAEILTQYTRDPDSLLNEELLWRNMPEAWRESAFSRIISYYGAPSGEAAAMDRGAASNGPGAVIGKGAEIGISILGFVLNSIYKNISETENGRALGEFLYYLNKTKQPPGWQEILQNLMAIKEGIHKIDVDLNNFWSAMESEVEDIKRIVLETKVQDAAGNIRTWHARLAEWGKDFRDNNRKPDQAVIDEWILDVNDPGSGVRQRVEDIYNGLFPAYGKSVIETWHDGLKNVANPNDKPEMNGYVYEAMKRNLVLLILYQAMGVNIYAEMVNRSQSEEDAKVLILDFTQTVMSWIQSEIEEFERVVELYALNQEWYIYSNRAELTADERCADFPGGLAAKGILADLDRIVQRYVFAELTYNQESGRLQSINQQHLITVRIVAPKNDADVEDDFGLAGLENQSGYFWDVYNYHAYAQYGSFVDDYWAPGWKPEGFPTADSAPPGAETADRDFELSSLEVTPWLYDNSAHTITYEPVELYGRSPFETRNTQMGGRESWSYRMMKYRMAFPDGNPAHIEPDKDYEVELKAQPGDGSAWHPNLRPVSLIQDTGNPDIIRWDNSKDPAMALTFGAYGIKAPQKVRLMAYHGQTPYRTVHDWWYRGWKYNNYDIDRLFANNHQAYTFFNLYPLGQGWYALKDAGTRATNFQQNLMPITFFGQLSSEYVQTSGRDYVRVSDNGELKFNLSFIDYPSAFKLSLKDQVDSVPAWIGEYGPHEYTVTQPAAGLYTFKTNYPNIDSPGDNNYLKWSALFGKWDRYYADGTISDLGDRDTWVMILPEYDHVAKWLIQRPYNWNPAE